MIHEFFINSGSTLNTLKIELIEKPFYHQFDKFYEVMQDATITFSMKNVDTDILKVSNSPATIKLIEDGSCDERYAVCYEWKNRDTKEKGVYEGWFNITFNGDITQDGVQYPTGNLIVPIQEKLYIYIR